MNYRIEEKYDGRLPEYHIIRHEDNLSLKVFDSLLEAEKYLNSLYSTPCGEENPCQ